MAKRQIAPTRIAADALAVLGAQIRFARHRKNWTAANLGMRIGVSARTITAVEKGSPSVAVGTVLNAASVVGVPLFAAEGEELRRLRRRGEERISLIPSREYPPRDDDGDDNDLDF